MTLTLCSPTEHSGRCALSRGENAGIGEAAAITAGSTSAIRVVRPIARTVAAMVATHRCALQSETAAIVDPATITALAATKSSVAGNVGTYDAVGNKQGSCVIDAATRSACGAFTVLTLCTGSTPIVNEQLYGDAIGGWQVRACLTHS